MVLDRHDAAVTFDELLVLEQAEVRSGAERDDRCLGGLTLVAEAGRAAVKRRVGQTKKLGRA